MGTGLREIACGMELFHGLSSARMDDILYRLNAVKKEYRKGEIVMLAGRTANRLLAVASGHLHAYGEMSANHVVLMREIHAGEVLGLWILNIPEVTCWPCTIIAAKDSVIVSLDMGAAREMIESCEPHVLNMAVNASRILSRELFSTWRKLMVMDAPTIEARVMVYLCELANENGGKGEVSVPFDRERMAEYLGVTRPSLSRALGHLRDRGLLTWRKNIFHIHQQGMA